MKINNFKELNTNIHLGFFNISNLSDFCNSSQTTFHAFQNLFSQISSTLVLNYFYSGAGFLLPLSHPNIPTFPVPEMLLYTPFLWLHQSTSGGKGQSLTQSAPTNAQ